MGWQIRVFCRLRPHPHSAVAIGADGATVRLTAEGREQAFTFDRVFGPAASQGEVFAEVSELVQSALDGYKARPEPGLSVWLRLFMHASLAEVFAISDSELVRSALGGLQCVPRTRARLRAGVGT